MNTQNEFRNTAKSFVNKAIRVRKTLIKSQGNKKDFADMEYACKWLSTHINGLKFDNEQMAGFILKHREKIYEILPGKNAGNSESLEIEFAEIIEKARTLKSYNLKSIFI